MPEQDGRGARKRSFVSGPVGTPRRSPNDRRNDRIMHFARNTPRNRPICDPRHMGTVCTRAAISLLRQDLAFDSATLGFAYRILTRSPFKGLYKQKLRFERLNTLWKIAMYITYNFLITCINHADILIYRHIYFSLYI